MSKKRRLDVWLWMTSHAQLFEGGYIVLATQREMAKDTGYCLSQVNTAVRELVEMGKVEPLQNGVYFIPGLLFLPELEVAGE